MEILHRLARDQGMTVVTVIHQPRSEIFALIDDVVLLARGGRLAYTGPRSQVHAYFRAMGYVCPPTVALADYLADVVNGAHGPPPSPAAFVAAAGERRPTGTAAAAGAAATATGDAAPVFADTAAAWAGGGAVWLAERLVRLGRSHLVSLPSLMAGRGGGEAVVALLRSRSAALPETVARLPSMAGLTTPRGSIHVADAIPGGGAMVTDDGSAFAGSNPMRMGTGTPAHAAAPGSADAATALPPGFTLAPPSPPSGAPAVSSKAEDAEAFAVRAKAMLAKRGGASFLQQVWLSAKRAALQHSRGTSLLSDMAAQFVRARSRCRDHICGSSLSHFACHRLFLPPFPQIGGAVIGIASSGGPLFVMPPPVMYRRSCPPGQFLCNREDRAATLARAMPHPNHAPHPRSVVA